MKILKKQQVCGVRYKNVDFCNCFGGMKFVKKQQVFVIESEVLHAAGGEVSDEETDGPRESLTALQSAAEDCNLVPDAGKA